MTKGTAIDGLILSLLIAAAVNVCVSQSNPEQDVGKTVSWQKDLPPNAKLHEMTADEMKKYDSEALVKAEVNPGQIVHATLRGFESIDPAKLQILREQKLAASAMKLHATVPAVQTSASQPGSQATSTVTAARVPSRTATASTMQSAVQATAAGGVQTAATTTLAKPMLLPAQPGSSPSTLMSAPGAGGGSPNTLASSSPPVVAAPYKPSLGATAPPLSNVTYVCQSPMIFDVNKQTKNAVFTPELEYNSYVIRGCFFGKQTGQIYLVGKFNAQQVNLQPQFWSDTEIDARVDPKTSGEQDVQNVTLIIAPAGAGQIKATGFEFIAARSNPAVLLASIPKTWLTYSGWNGAWTNPELNFQSPVKPGANAPNSMAGYSAYVSRSSNKKFSPGTDTYTPQLAEGWTFDSVQMTAIGAPPSCPGVVTYRQSFGLPQAGTLPIMPDWTKEKRYGARVDGSDTSCSGFIPIAPPFVYWTYSDATGSAYGLKIWAVGPRCTDPYTGLPAAECMRNMQQCGTETCSN